jgi:hypothetical protein
MAQAFERVFTDQHNAELAALAHRRSSTKLCVTPIRATSRVGGAAAVTRVVAGSLMCSWFSGSAESCTCRVAGQLDSLQRATQGLLQIIETQCRRADYDSAGASLIAGVEARSGGNGPSKSAARRPSRDLPKWFFWEDC